ncbi:hypothetical protein O3794_00675 [Gemella sanguinis]|uniref:hypothetical protein n=1 Tax=Gemella sanguinis TaxID=84135 RepID=UPI00352BE765
MLLSNEIMMLSIVASASAIRCGNRNANNIPAPSLAIGSDGETMINRKPIYSMVIARDILFKSSEKLLLFI